MADTIRNVVIKIALEQQNAQLTVPRTDQFQSAIAESMTASASAVKKPFLDAEAAVEHAVAQMGDAFNNLNPEQQNALRQKLTATAIKMSQQQAAEAERAYDSEAKAATSAYSRIMAERARNERDAERKYDQEAAEAQKAYSRILQARETAAVQEVAAGRRVAQMNSSLMSSYGAAAMGALQLAKGIAFVVAADEKQSEQMVKTIVKMQGYFDLGVGTVHVLKSINDVRRFSVQLLQAEAAAATAAAAANAVNNASGGVGKGAAGAAGGSAVAGAVGGSAGAAVAKAIGGAAAAAVTALTVTVGLAAVAVFAVVKAYLYWGAEAERVMKGIEEDHQHHADAFIAAEQRMAAAVRERSSFEAQHAAGRQDEEGVAAAVQAAQSARDRLAAAEKNVSVNLDSRTSQLPGLQQKLDLRKQELEASKHSYELAGQQVALLESQAAKYRDILNIAREAENSEQRRYDASKANLGALSRADLAKAKRIEQKATAGGQLSFHEEDFALRLGLKNAGAQARARREKQGNENEGLIDRSSLDMLRKNREADQNRLDPLITDIDKKAAEARKSQQDLAIAVLDAMESVKVRTEIITKLTETIEQIKRDQAKLWIWQRSNGTI